MKKQLFTLQLVRYAVIGVSTSLVSYLLYLTITWAGVGHKLTMTLLYAFGVLLSFFLNRRWTFDYSGEMGGAMIRHWTAYGFGYILNFLALLILVDVFEFPHQIIQGIMILALAAMLFLLQRYWVFRPRHLGTDRQT